MKKIGKISLQKTMKAGKNHANNSSELNGKYMDHSRNLGDVIAVTLLILSKAKLIEHTSLKHKNSCVGSK